MIPARRTSFLAGSLAALTLALVPPACALPFVETATTFVPVVRSAVAWGDFDRDGDLDLILTGLSSSGPDVSVIYRNDGGGSFTDLGASLLGMESGSANWIDYDRDGDLDLFLCGTFADPPSALYRNDGALGFTKLGVEFHSVYQSSSTWGDVDNDGDADLVLAGSRSSVGDVAEIYRNDGHDLFTLVPLAVPGFRRGSLDLGDFDGDGDLDLLVTGIRGLAMSRIYRNDGGTFTDTGAPLQNLYDGRGEWCDFDGDGDLDALIDGSDDSGSHVFTRLYRNDGASFAEAPFALPGAGEGSDLRWGDVDNDGDPDFAVTALNFGQSDVFRNDGTSFVQANQPLSDVCCGAIAFGDADGDADLDLFLSGFPETTRLYRNQAPTPNTPPSAPTALAANVLGQDVVLSWLRGQDTETAALGLGYNLRVGTTPGGVDVVSPMADVATGRRLVVDRGNVGPAPAWRLRGLANGTYFWSVQSIDAAFAGSPFAPEGTFTVGTVDVAPATNGRLRITQPFASPLQGQGTMRFVLPEPRIVSIDVFDLAGRRVATLAEGERAAGVQSVEWRAPELPAGVYLVRLAAGTEQLGSRVLWLGR
jgi:FG-GAP-like repeat